MKIIREIIAVFLTIGGIIFVVVLPFRYEAVRLSPENNKVDRVVTITGYGQQGVWTEEEINGLNYWWKEFQRADIKVRKGEKILVRLKSADTIHGFYLPQLNIGPLEVYPGRVEEFKLEFEKSGDYWFVCKNPCGDEHKLLTGKFTVIE